MNLNYAQLIVTALLSSGFVTGMIALFGKTLTSPESKNDLARLGNEFAHQLLLDAKSEREELRLTIRELEQTNITQIDIIGRLEKLAHEKDKVIEELERRQIVIANKLQAGDPITLQDIFGPTAPKEFQLSNVNAEIV